MEYNLNKRIAFILLAIAVINHNNNGIAEADILYAGVVYGTSGTNVPEAAEAFALCHEYGIRRVRTLDDNTTAIQFLRGMELEATVGVKNEDLAGLASSYESVKTWFANNLQPYVPHDFVVNYIVVSNMAIPGPYGKYVLLVAANLQKVLADNNLRQIKVATAVSTSVLASTFPPSNAAFSAESQGDLTPLLRHLDATESPILISEYPYYYYAAGLINQDFATFSTDKPVYWDGKFGYWSMFDALWDNSYGQWRKSV